MKMKVHEARLQTEDDSEVAAMFSKLQTRKCWKTRDRGSESDGSRSEDDKHASRRTNRRDTQGCYRCYKVGHIVRYCPSTAPVESAALTETAAGATTMSTTSVENYWMTVTNRESPSKEMLTKGFGPQAIGTKICTRLSGLGTEPISLPASGLVRRLCLHNPRAWCGSDFPASLGLGTETISPPSLGLVWKLFPHEPLV